MARLLSSCLLPVLCLALVWGSAQAQDEFDPDSNSFKYEFRNGSSFWIPVFSDYNMGTLERGLTAVFQPLPSNVTLDSSESDTANTSLSGLSWKLESENLSNGAFMGLKKKLNISQTGITVGSNYTVTIRVWFASNTAPNCSAIGGDTAAVDVKAGVFHEEPTVVHATDDYWMLVADQVPCSSLNETNSTATENVTGPSNNTNNGCVCNFLCVVGEQCCCLDNGPVCVANGVCPDHALGYSSLEVAGEQSEEDTSYTDTGSEGSESSETSASTESGSAVSNNNKNAVTAANAISPIPKTQFVPCSAVGKVCSVLCARGKQCCCNAATGAVTCVPIGSCPTKACGNKYCKASETCCTPSCGGVCSKSNVCLLIACTPTCGNTRCASNQKCCSACGGTVKRCIPKAIACPRVLCPVRPKCGTKRCNFGEQCCPLCPGQAPKCFSTKYACPKVFCPVGVKCGTKFCQAGQKCCSALCNHCAPKNALCPICDPPPLVAATSRAVRRLGLSRATVATNTSGSDNGTELCVSEDHRGSGEVIGDISVQSAVCSNNSTDNSTESELPDNTSSNSDQCDNNSNSPSSWFVKRIEHTLSTSYAYTNETGSDIWVLIGTKSRYAGRTTVYWMHVEVQITSEAVAV